VTAALDGAAHAFSMETRQPAFAPLRHQGQVPHVEFSRDGARLLTCSGDKTVRLWDATSGQALGEPLGHPDGLLEASLNASGTRIIARTYKYELFLWDAAAGRLIRRLEGKGFGPAHFNVDGTRIAALAPGNRVQLWESETGHSVALPLGVSGAVTALEFSADGQGVFLGYQGTNGLPAIQLRHWDSGVVVGPTLAVPALPTQVLPSPDGRQLAVLDGANTFRIWTWPSGILMGSGYQHPQSVYSMVFSADSRLVATACEDGAARVFDGRRGKLVAPPFPNGERAIHAVFSPDAAWLGTVSSDSTARLWRLDVNESSEQDLQRLSARLNGTAR
jgi:WD40 repeat protein